MIEIVLGAAMLFGGLWLLQAWGIGSEHSLEYRVIQGLKQTLTLLACVAFALVAIGLVAYGAQVIGR